jgi:DNA-binding NarL/FixJ family response regulator
MDNKPAIRILIADDHPVVRDGLSVMLETQADFMVVAGAADGTATLEKTASYQPDVVLLDLEMPGMDGVAVLQALGKDHPEVAVIVFTAYDTDERIIQAVRAGARGYLLKGAPREQLFEAIRTVHGGGSLLQPLVAQKLMQHVAAETQSDQHPTHTALTNREQDILRELSTGKTNKEIARTLFISERTVKFHVSSILRKLEVSNRTEAVKTAVQRGLITW